MQKVRYRQSSNSLHIKFQYYFISESRSIFTPSFTLLFTIETRFYLALEVDSPIFYRIITFYGILVI